MLLWKTWCWNAAKSPPLLSQGSTGLHWGFSVCAQIVKTLVVDIPQFIKIWHSPLCILGNWFYLGHWMPYVIWVEPASLSGGRERNLRGRVPAKMVSCCSHTSCMAFQQQHYMPWKIGNSIVVGNCILNMRMGGLKRFPVHFCMLLKGRSDRRGAWALAATQHFLFFGFTNCSRMKCAARWWWFFAPQSELCSNLYNVLIARGGAF